MLKLPKIPYSMEKNKQQVVSLGNVNYSKMIKDGDVADSSGISGRHFPYITTAKETVEQERSFKEDGVRLAAITVFRGKFVEIYDNGYVFYGGEYAGALQGKKEDYGNVQFAPINTKLVMMPFKVYLDAGGEVVQLKSLGEKITTTTQTRFDKNSITLAGEASHSFKTIGGSIQDDTITFKPRVNEKKFTGSDSVLWVDDEQGDSCRVSFWKFATSTIRWGENTVCAYMDSDQRDSLGEHGSLARKILIYDPVNEKNSGIYVIKEILLNEGFGGANFTEITLYENLSTSGGTDRELKIYEIDTQEDLTNFDSNYEYSFNCARMEIKPASYGSYKYYYGHLNTYSNLEGFATFTTLNESLPPAGVCVGVADNGGLFERLPDYISSGRTVEIAATNSMGRYSYSGTVFEVSDNYIIFNKAITLPVMASIIDSGLITITVTENGNGDLGRLFFSGDVLNVSGCNNEKNNIAFAVDSISEDGKTIYAPSDVFEACEGNSITIERRIPRLDYICEHDNRLYGCSNEDNTIYASALGDPTNIYAYKGVSTDSYAVAVASEEPFTGCCPYDGGVMFWKENKLHKLLGSYPAEYALYTYNIDGVQEGSHKSLQNIGEVLYYKGVRGVFAFDGSPRLISENFGDKNFKGAVGGSDGGSYYISMADEAGRSHFFSYNTRIGLWVRESGAEVSCFARKGKDTYMLEGGEIKLYGAEDAGTDNEWFVQFTPIYETIEGKKSYSRIKLRLELPRGSYMVISVRCDGGRWAECGKVIGRVEGVIPVMVPINRCDKFELKIEGKGPCVIHSILREFYVGGDK